MTFAPLPYPRPGASQLAGVLSVSLGKAGGFPVSGFLPELPGGSAFASAGSFRGLIFQPLAHAFHNLRSGFSNSDPRHSQASVPVMIDHHTEGFGNVPTDFGA